MRTFIDMTGKRFGRLVVMKQDSNLTNSIRWICLCDCGKTKSIAGTKLRNGNTKSCRCLDTEMTIERTKTHGLSRTPEYMIWKTMRQRCNNPTYKNYADYGGRGIKICKRWDDFTKFLEDMGKRPTHRHQIDRKDNDGNYEPGNCRWVTQLVQANNKRNNTMLTYRGTTDTLPNWARQVGLKSATLRARIFAYNWPIELALTKELK